MIFSLSNITPLWGDKMDRIKKKIKILHISYTGDSQNVGRSSQVGCKGAAGGPWSDLQEIGFILFTLKLPLDI